MTLPERHASAWQATSTLTRHEKLETDIEVDVAILGGGITGLTAAFLLAEAGKRVVLVERDRLGSGVTGRTTAHFATIPDVGYSEVAKSFGDEAARLVHEGMSGAVARVRDLTERLSIDCAFERVPGFFYAERTGDSDMIEQELRAAERAGARVAIERSLPPQLRSVIAMRVEDQARLHPLAYLAGLARAAEERGARLFEDTRATRIDDGEPCIVRTESGATIRARDVILATHTPPGIHVLHTEVGPYRSYVIAVRLGQPFPDGLYWDSDDPYHYVRRHPLPDGEVLIVGGSDHKTGHGDPAAAYDALEAWTRDRFDVQSIAYRWSAQVYEPIDGLPFIGRSHGTRHVHVLTGYAGDGMTFGTLGAMLTTEAILGRSHPLHDVLRPVRVKPIAGGIDFVKENLDVATRFVVDRIARADAAGFDEVPAGEARVVKIGKRKVAAYRDESGTLHAASAVCAHMKCIVHFNAAERSWDCPCHGARYDVDGRTIEGPAIHDLGRVTIEREQPAEAPPPEAPSTASEASPPAKARKRASRRPRGGTP